MDENEFRKTLDELRELPCAFQKAILNRQANCSQVQRFNLGDREGVTCSAWPAQQNCQVLLGLLHEKARFVLRLSGVPAALPHARELRVQAGGLGGLKALLEPNAEGPVNDIHGLVNEARQRFGRLEEIPFQEVVKGIAAFQGRRKPGRKPGTPAP